MSALVHALLEGGSLGMRAAQEKRLRTAGKFAAHAAAITVSRAGAEPPTLLEVEAAWSSAALA